MIKILVVDDDEALTEALEIILSDEGYCVNVMHAGEQVDGQLKDIRPDIIILDYRLPGEDGASVARRIKTDKTTCNIPILMISASNSVEKTARANGVNEFLPKPFSVDRLLEVIKETTNP